MHPKFADAVEKLHSTFEKLIAMTPCSAGQLPRDMPKSGVYLFSENGKHLYVGRSRNIRGRYGMHTRPSSDFNQASFAFLLARESTGQNDASYKNDGKSRSGLAKEPAFVEAFSQAKTRIRAMEFRFVEESDPTRQALLEIYCSVALDTPYNSFRTH